MRVIAAIAAAALALTACGAPTPSRESSSASAPATVPDQPGASSAPQTDQGFMPKKIGEQAGFKNQDGSLAVEFWITKITVDPKCSPYMNREPGKHTLVIDITVQTHTSDDPGFVTALGAINPFSLQTKGQDGVTNQAGIASCILSPKALPNAYSPNSKYTGQLVIETVNQHGKLLMTNSPFASTSGWEWPY